MRYAIEGTATYKNIFLVEADDPQEAVQRWRDWFDAEDNVLESILAGDCEITEEVLGVGSYSILEEDILTDEDYQEIMDF